MDFNSLSTDYYQPYSWQSRDFEPTASLGFVSPYAGAEVREDFVEVIANYIVKTDERWENILDIASKGWALEMDIFGNPIRDENGKRVYKEVIDSDGVDGKTLILQKLWICKQWMRESWNVDLDKLREEVQTRQKNMDIHLLRNQLKQ